MKAFVYTGQNILKEENIQKPELKDLGAIIKLNGCGLCGSDIVKIKENIVKAGTVLGHEVVGIIEEIKTKTDFKVGDRVVLGHHVPCYDCVFCKNKNYSMCSEFKSSNIIPGGFCEYIYVSEKHLEDTVQKVPPNLSDVQASFTEPAACCLRAVNRSGIKKGDVVFIVGLGSIGLLMGQILKSFGAKVAGCDLVDERIILAENLGFDKVYKYSCDEEISEAIKKDFNSCGADVIFLASGSEKTIPFALKSVRDGGKICVFASVSSHTAGFSNNEIYYRDLTVFGSYSPSSADLKEALKLIENNIIKTDFLVSEYDFDELNRAIEDTLSNKIIKAYIKINGIIP